MTTCPWHARFLVWPIRVGVVLLLIVWALPANGNEGFTVFASLAAGLVGLSLAAGALASLAQGMAGEQQYGRFYGTTFRTLIPMLALVIVVLGVVTKPYLVYAEGRYLAQDTLISDPVRPGFTRVENDLVERLRGEIQARIESGVQPGEE